MAQRVEAACHECRRKHGTSEGTNHGHSSILPLPAARQILDRSHVLTTTHRQARDFAEKLANAKADGPATGCTTVTRTALLRCVSHRPALLASPK
jgi:hypothetical protein